MDMTAILGGVTLPKVGPDGFQLAFTPNETTNQVISGNIYTDFISNHRTWTMSWASLEASDWTTIENLYLSQFSGNTFLNFTLAAYSINCNVKVVIDPANIRYNGTLVLGVKLTLIEQLAI